MSDATIYSGGPLRREIPDVDLTSFTLSRAKALGDKPALIDAGSGRALSYGELERSVGSFAAGLVEHGFAKGDTLAIYMPNLPEYAVAFFGAGAAGGRCTTVNPLYTARELGFQLADAGAKMMLTVAPLLDTARKAAAHARCEVVVLDGGDDESSFADLFGDSDAIRRPPIDAASDIAAIPYSSGTTGLPKGVLLSHRNLVANLVQAEAALDLRVDDVVIAALPLFHLYGLNVILSSGLLAGATLVTLPRFELGEFLQALEHHRVTRAFVVPPIALALATHPAVAGHDLSALRHILCGAAPLGAELAEACERRLGCAVRQGYGLTETSPLTHLASAAEPGTVGPPIPGTECRLVDPSSGRESAAGERGELWIRGPQVMQGYLNNPRATAAMIDEQGWLHTGDIAVVDDAGSFAIVDRVKELIKYKGFQVAPAELEAILLTHPEVADCAVVGVPDEVAGETPKAFVVRAGDELDPDAVTRFVAEQVSPEKQIRAIEVIDTIPRSASGKILRRELRDRYETLRKRHQADAMTLAPRLIEQLEWPPERLAEHRVARLRELVRHAVDRSSWHRERLAGVDVESLDETTLRSLPPMTKADLMRNYDRILTDSRLSLELINRHLQTVTTGSYLLDRYTAVTSGGSTGTRAVFVYDWDYWATFYLGVFRYLLRAKSSDPELASRPVVWAWVAAAHFTHATAALSRTFTSPDFVNLRFPVTLATEEIVAGLNEAQPDFLVAYPSSLHVLSFEAQAGRLRIAPRRLLSCAEPLLPEIRAAAEDAWGVRVGNLWGTSEAGGTAIPCDHGSSHLSEDLMIVEPVDADGRPVAAGQRSAKVYVTNLYNLALPLIRYELTDEVTILEQPCACDSAHRCVADIQGRLDDLFVYEGLRVHPHLFRSVLARHQGVVEYQVRQTERGARIAVSCSAPVDLQALAGELAQALGGLGLSNPLVEVTAVDRLDRDSGPAKLKRFVPLPVDELRDRNRGHRAQISDHTRDASNWGHERAARSRHRGAA